ncbi:MAG TPA: fumarylacetoacetate hydrolase family protein [Candidatus Dormibacteraeota bacterium]|jgi:2-dehydro-3-deoxy-D-arabinonate dehydratase|nr:fumarylacetoacetate hydrolase family protein [Candidatus Dormibacteraeota bacterium]
MPIDSTDLPDLPALVRARDAQGVVALLLWRDGRLRRLGTSLDALLERPLDRIRVELEEVGEEVDPSGLDLLAPVEGQEVWAAGVTYRRSREARREESSQGGDFYDLVYEAARPELFFKASGWRVVGPGGEVGVRSDSSWDVPEPELVVLSNRRGEVVAYSCGNDMSSRSIEGENPLYLPQAKVYDRSCAIGPIAVLAWEYEPAGKEMRLEIRRRGEAVFEGTASLDDMVRRPDEVTGVLHSALTLPLGAWLMTGTSIVPEPDYTARPGDEVVISIEGLGRLRNSVVEVSVGSAAAPARIR